MHRLAREHDQAVDGLLGQAIDGQPDDADPDALLHEVSWIVADVLDDRPEATVAPKCDLLLLQPRLDGTGGRIFGDLTAASFAVVDAATDPGPIAGSARHGFGTDPDHRARLEQRRQLGAARAARLVDRLSVDPTTGERQPPKLLLRVDLDRLLDGKGRAVAALTTLAGGIMHCTPSAADRLLAAGADLRLIVTDDGTPIATSRRTRVPTDALADVLLALHDTCTEPGCRVAARVCDRDHAVPVDHGGTTTVDNLGPLCATANRRRGDWHATQTAAGVRRWRHTRSGLSITTAPATHRTLRGPPVPVGTCVGPPHTDGGPPRHPPPTTPPPGAYRAYPPRRDG